MAVLAGGAVKVPGWSNRVVAVALLAGCLTLVHAAPVDFFRLVVAGGTTAHLGGIGVRDFLDIVTVHALQRAVDGLLESTGVKKK